MNKRRTLQRGKRRTLQRGKRRTLQRGKRRGKQHGKPAGASLNKTPPMTREELRSFMNMIQGSPNLPMISPQKWMDFQTSYQFYANQDKNKNESNIIKYQNELYTHDKPLSPSSRDLRKKRSEIESSTKEFVDQSKPTNR